MSEITGPYEIQLSKAEIELLKNGETVTRELDTDIDGTSELQIEWCTVYESEGTEELFDELNRFFNE